MIPPDDTFPDRLKAVGEWMAKKVRDKMADTTNILPSRMSRDELVDFASNFGAPMGTVQNVGKKAAKAALPRLSALHNTTAKKLQQAVDLDGFPVPSVAVVPENVPFTEFGDVTLIGRKSLGDPKMSRVFSDDVYSPRVPEPKYPKPNAKAVSQTYEKMVGAPGDRFSSRMYKAMEDGRWDDAVADSYGNAAVVGAFEKANGMIPSKSAMPPRGREQEFYAWVRQQFSPLIGEKRVEVSGRLKPWNVDNVAQSMKTAPVNKEAVLSYGPGNIRAANAKRFTSLEQMRAAAAQRIRPRNETPELKELNDQLGAFTQKFRPFDPQTGRNFTLDGNAAEMLADVPKIGARAAAVKHGYTGVPEELLDEADTFMKRFMDAPANYFESKPARGVRFDEFAGAVLPENAPETLAEALRQRGLLVERYSDPAARAGLVRDLRKRLNDAGAGTLFQLLAGVGIGGAMMAPEDRRGRQVLGQ